MNPAIPECRNFICHVVGDIVRRYDVDGLHIDDYFYPYPAAGQTIPDDQLFRSNPRGFTNKGDWRRDNVNIFIRQLSDTIHQNKPWVKFGVSPGQTTRAYEANQNRNNRGTATSPGRFGNNRNNTNVNTNNNRTYTPTPVNTSRSSGSTGGGGFSGGGGGGTRSSGSTGGGGGGGRFGGRR